VFVRNGAAAFTVTVRADRTMPCVVSAWRSTSHRTGAVMTDPGGAAERAATSAGEGSRLTGAKPGGGITTSPAASPPRKKRLALSGSARDPPYTETPRLLAQITTALGARSGLRNACRAALMVRCAPGQTSRVRYGAEGTWLPGICGWPANISARG